jgi:hypothetical protein
MRRHRVLWLAWVAWATTALADPERVAVVWFRSSEGCPDGSEFLAKLGERAPLARLARAGDHVDFVVTLSVSERESVGRLERQTQSGTVAIREITDSDCGRAAEAIALSLALALNPPAEPPAPDPTPTASVPPAPTSPPAPPPRSEPVTPPARVDAPIREQTAPGSWLVGAEGGTVTGASPSAMGAAHGFLERENVLWPGSSFSLGAEGAFGSSQTAVGRLRSWIFGARIEACPSEVGGSRLSLAPCAALDLGATGASGPRGGAGPWAALGALGRGRLWVTRSVALEARAGAVFPLIRYDLNGHSMTVYRTAPVGFGGSLGASFRLP